MTNHELRQQIEKATRLVEASPAWKQNILVHSARPSVSSPRPPVDNQTGQVNAHLREAKIPQD